MPRITQQKPGAVRRVAQPKSILSRASSIEIDPDEPINVGVFGESATGKTTFWSSFPKPILALIHSGTNNPGELISIPAKTRKQIHTLNLAHCEEVNEVVDAIADSDYKTLVLDHLTSFSDLVLMEVLGVTEIPPQLSWGFASQQQWQKHGSLTKTFLKRMLDAPTNTVIVSQQRWFEPPEDSRSIDDGLSISKVGPAATPTIAGWLAATLNYSIQTFVRNKVIEKKIKINGKEQVTKNKTEEIEFCAYLPLHPERMTKFRTPVGYNKVPKILVDPTYDKLREFIHGMAD